SESGFVKTITEDWGSAVSTDCTTMLEAGSIGALTMGGAEATFGPAGPWRPAIRSHGASTARVASAAAARAEPMARRRRRPTTVSHTSRQAGRGSGVGAVARRVRSWGQNACQT